MCVETRCRSEKSIKPPRDYFDTGGVEEYGTRFRRRRIYDPTPCVAKYKTRYGIDECETKSHLSLYMRPDLGVAELKIRLHLSRIIRTDLMSQKIRPMVFYMLRHTVLVCLETFMMSPKEKRINRYLRAWTLMVIADLTEILQHCCCAVSKRFHKTGKYLWIQI